MSLTDLKKSKDDNRKKKKFTVDEFIADAENYAQGSAEIVSSDTKNQMSLTQAVIAAQQHVARKEHAAENDSQDGELQEGTSQAGESQDKQPFRHATFTLSEEAIVQLQDLSIDTKLAKSHILRILIDELCNKDQQAKLHKLLGSKID